MSDDAHAPLPAVPPAEAIRLTEVLQALGDANRLRIVHVLADGEWHPCADAYASLDLQKSTISHHLKTLREAGVTEYRMSGRTKDARLRADVLESRFPGLLAGILSPEAAAAAQAD